MVDRWLASHAGCTASKGTDGNPPAGNLSADEAAFAKKHYYQNPRFPGPEKWRKGIFFSGDWTAAS